MELKEFNRKEDRIVIEMGHDEFYGIFNVMTAALQQYSSLDDVILERSKDEIRSLYDKVSTITSKIAAL